jgi:hypothetical protein
VELLSPNSKRRKPNLRDKGEAKGKGQYVDDEEEMEIESTLPEPAAAAAAATRSLTSKNAAAAGGSPGMPAVCGDAIALLLLQAGASCTIQNR